MNTTTNTSVQPVVSDEIRAIIKNGNLTDVLSAIESSKANYVEVQIAGAVVPVAITESQRSAIESLPSVYGKVVPTDKRMLLPAEVAALAAEREALDELEKMVKARRESIRTTVVNHMDESLFASLTDAERDALDIDGEGHVLVKQTLSIPDSAKAFSWEIRESAPSLDADALKDLDVAGEIDHDLYLSMTTQVRVVDEMKVMAAMKTDPDATLSAITKASKPGKRIGSLYVRKAK